MDSSELTREVQKLVASRLDPPAFYKRLLSAICNGVGSPGGVAWGCRTNPAREIVHYHSDENRPIRLSCTADEHTHLLEATCLQRESKLAFPKVQEGDEDSDNPPPVILMSPVIVGNSCRTVIEVFLPLGATDEEYQNTVRAIIGVCDEVIQYETMRETAIHEAGQQQAAQQVAAQQMAAQQQAAQQAAAAQGGPRFGAPEGAAGLAAVTNALSPQQAAGGNLDVDAFADQIHSSIDWKETAAQVANEARRVLQCDRVSVLQFQRNKAKTVAVSGQPSVNRRSNTIRGLEKVGTNTLRIGDELWYPSDEKLPPQIDSALERYFLESVVKTMTVIPLMDRRPKPDPEDEKKQKIPKVFAGLVIEYLNESANEQAVKPQIDALARHSENALRNAHQHRSMFLFKLWDAMGKSKIITTMRNLPITLGVLAGLTLLTLALIFVPADFNISSDGNLIPLEREDVFAHADGTVKKVHVDHRSEVIAGQTLLELENKDRDLQLQQVLGEMQQAKDSLATIRTARLSGASSGLSEQELNSLVRDQRQTESQIESLEKQTAILKEQMSKLKVVAGQSGTVLTWNVDELFQERPVRQGELLLEVANLEGEWQLELDLPDRRIGHVLRAQREIEGDLPVSFVLASDAGRRLEGHVTEISRKTQVDQEKGQTIRVTVAIDSEDIEFLQSSTGVTAKIQCGRRSLGYVWLHDVFEFVQAKVLFHLN